MASVNEHIGNIKGFHSKKASGYYEGDFANQKLKDGYFSSSDPMGGYELADKFSLPGEMRGAGRDGMRRDSDRSVYIYKKDEMPSSDKAPAAPSPTPTPEPVQSEPTNVSPEIEYSPQIQNAQQFVNRFEQGSTPYNDLSSQDFLNSYKQGFDTRNSTAVESVGANLNFDLPNNVDTTDNNMFANNTFNPIDKSDEAAQNFLSDKKKLILG